MRFAAERAYVVTARVDPLYVIDLSDADDPFIAGELEMPGFATYLQPLGVGGIRTVAVGRSADDSHGVRRA